MLVGFTLMRSILVIAWLVAIVYSIPNLIAYDTIDLTEGDVTVHYCIHTGQIPLNVMIMINFILWYCIPLLLMTLMYSKISIVLWKSSTNKTVVKKQQRNSLLVTTSAGGERRTLQSSADQIMELDNCGATVNSRKTSLNGTAHQELTTELPKPHNPRLLANPPSRLKVKCAANNNALGTRRKVIRLMISIVVSFALCMLPHHIRLLYEMYAPLSTHPSFIQHLIPPLTFLLFYLNSALNPVLYAFLSENFRKSFKEIYSPERTQRERTVTTAQRNTVKQTLIRN